MTRHAGIVYTHGSLATYVAVDIETTGFEATCNRITELCAIRVTNGAVVDWFETLVNPACKIPDRITEITGITNDMVADSPLITEALRHFIPYVGSDVVVAHNAPFDLGFLYEHSRRPFQTGFAPMFIDTLTLSRGLFPDLPNHKLPTVARRCEVHVARKHRAMADAVVTWKCYEYMKAAANYWNIALPPPKKFEPPRRERGGRNPVAADVVSSKYVRTYKKEFDTSSPVYGKRFAFTGESDVMARDDAIKAVVDRGGSCGDTVIRKTDYLVICQDDKWMTGHRSQKFHRARELEAQGYPIKTIFESDFLMLLAQGKKR